MSLAVASGSRRRHSSSSLPSTPRRSERVPLLLPLAMPSNYASAPQSEDVDVEAKEATKVERAVKGRIHDLLTIQRASPSHSPIPDIHHHYAPPSPIPIPNDSDDEYDHTPPTSHLPNEGWHAASDPSSLHPSTPPTGQSSSHRRLLHVAFVALRRNLIPGLILQAFALFLLILYFSSSTVQSAFDAVAAVKDTYGVFFSAVVSAIAGGLIPALLLSHQHRREERRKMAQGKEVQPRVPLMKWEAAFLVGLWAYKGIEVDLFYTLQGVMFGTSNSATVVVPKVLVDMSATRTSTSHTRSPATRPHVRRDQQLTAVRCARLCLCAWSGSASSAHTAETATTQPHALQCRRRTPPGLRVGVFNHSRCS